MTSDTRHSILLISWSLAVLTYTCHAESLANDKLSSSCARLESQMEAASESLLQMNHKRNSNGVADIGDDLKVDRNGQSMDKALVSDTPAAVPPSSLVASNVTSPMSAATGVSAAAMASEPTKSLPAAVQAHLTQQVDGLMASSRQTLGSAMLVAVMGLALLTMVPKDAAPSIPEKKRSMFLDNAKIFALFLVTFSDILYFNLATIHDNSVQGYSDWKTWLSGSAVLLHATLEGLNTVMVPMLCLISGVLSQGPTTERRIKRFIETLVVPTLIWVYFVKPVVLATLMDPDPNHFASRVLAIFKLRSFHEEWYLQALILWRLSAFLFWSHLRPSIAFMCMVALSGMAGYVNLNGPLWYLKLDEALGFLPYFGVGYIFPFDAVHRACERQRVPAIFAFALAVLWMFGLTGRVGPLPDSHGNYQCCAAGPYFKELQGWDYSLYWTQRITRLALEMPPTLLLMFSVVPQKETCITWIGQYTIYPYLFHQVANYWRSELFKYLHPPTVASTAGHVTILLLHMPYVLAVLVFFASRPWRMMFSWCLEPAWMKYLLKSPQNAKPGKSLEGSGTSPFLLSASQAHASNYAAAHELSMDHDNRSDRPLFSGISRTLEGLGDTTQWNDASPLECEDEDDAASEGSTPELLPSCRTHPGLWQSTGPSIPWQAEALKYYPWLLPLFLIIVFSVVFPFLVFQACVGVEFVIKLLETLPLALSTFFFLAALVMLTATYVFHYYRLRGTDQLPEAPTADPVAHAIVVVSYKEPIDVLERTLDSVVAQRGLRSKPIFVLATESRDPAAQGQFDSLRRRMGDAFEQSFITKHVLAEGETMGKSSNENWAVQELYRILVEEQARDPFEVLVTIIDADSVVSSTYLAHLEAQFRNMRDGRRLMYTGPLNVHRNFADACLLSQAIDLHRCHGDTFYDPLNEVQPQSNYSITLGFAQEIGFWTPDVMAEDIHANHRAMVHNFGSRTTVMIPSFICNDLVPAFSDRYVQAKRHQWGSMAETAWIISLLLDMRLGFPNWLQVLRNEMKREGSFFDAAARLAGAIVKLGFCISMLYVGHFTERNWKFKLYIAMCVVALTYAYAVYWVAECILWQTLLRQFPVKRPSYFRWTLLVCLMPILLLLSDMIFCVGASMHCLVLMSAGTGGDIRYVVAPKGDKLAGGHSKGQFAQQMLSAKGGKRPLASMASKSKLTGPCESDSATVLI